MIRVAIVEDEPEFLAQLQQFLDRYQQERGCEMRVCAFTDGEEIVRGYRADYDIILLDVQMAAMDGMTAAGHIRRHDPEVILIFITNMAQYAIRGYSVDALDYVLKPVSYFAFSQRLDRAMERLERAEQSRTSYLSISVKGGTQKLDVAQIRYVESNGHTLVFHIRHGVILAHGTMTEMEKKLAPCGFARCNKGYLINLDCVDAVRDGCVVVGEERLLISRGRKSTFLEQLAEYMGGKTR